MMLQRMNASCEAVICRTLSCNKDASVLRIGELLSAVEKELLENDRISAVSEMWAQRSSGNIGRRIGVEIGESRSHNTRRWRYVGTVQGL